MADKSSTSSEGHCSKDKSNQLPTNDHSSENTSKSIEVWRSDKSWSHITQTTSNNEQIYHIKWISWNTGKIPIVMQSNNGPCPLIAIVNVLSLREKLNLPEPKTQGLITKEQLLQTIGECLMNSIPDEIKDDPSSLRNYEQNVNDAIEVLPKLATGLDVNIKFGSITDFEYTSECIIFDLLRIPLYHGWIVGKSDPSIKAYSIIKEKSYNQLVDYIISNKNSNDSSVVINVLLAEDFLNQSASQLTESGLIQLNEKIANNEIGILFRNNHFLTIFKRDGRIYQLVTDQGFSKELIVWETLDNIGGDGKFLSSNFEVPDSIAATSSNQIDSSSYQYTDLDRQRQMENDFLVALSLKQQDDEDFKG